VRRKKGPTKKTDLKLFTAKYDGKYNIVPINPNLSQLLGVVPNNGLQYIVVPSKSCFFAIPVRSVRFGIPSIGRLKTFFSSKE
jgi:hypothetical protein